MKNFFSFDRNQRVVMITLFCLLGFGAFYLFIYVPGNKRIIEEQRFRTLQRIERNIHAKIENSTALVNTILNAYNKKTASVERWDNYTANYSKRGFALIKREKLSKRAKLLMEARTTDSLSVVNFVGNELQIYLYKGDYQIGIRYTVEQFFQPLLRSGDFNQFLLLEDGNVIYQDFASGVIRLSSDSSGKDDRISVKDNLKDLHLSGNTYKPFFHQIKLSDSTKLSIVGLLGKSDYNRQCSKLPAGTVLLLITIAFGLVLALPWIKLFQMGSQDRLTIYDGVFSFAVSMLLMSLLFFAFFKYNGSLRPGKSISEIMTESLARQIDQRYDIAIHEAYERLLLLNKYFNTNNDKVELNAFFKANNTNKLFIKQGFRMDSSGKEKYNYANDVLQVTKNTAPLGDYSNREYFFRLKTHKYFYLDSSPDKPFSLEQVISWTDGNFTTVMAIPAKAAENGETEYTAISFSPLCLNKPVLGAEMKYAIIDGDGRVLYHSDTTRNLNENLIEEISTHESFLPEAIATQSSKFFSAKYDGREQNFYVRPMANLPYFVVVMEQTAGKTYRDINVFVFCMMMLIVFFFVLNLQLLVVLLISGRNFKSNKSYRDISWIGPNGSLAVVYRRALLGNIATIILLVLFFRFTSFLQFVFILLSASLATTLYLNFFMMLHYRAKNKGAFKQKMRIVIALSCFLLLINWAVFFVIDIKWFFVFEAALFLSIAGIILLGQRFRITEDNLFFKIFKLSGTFSSMVFTRLVITSGLPVVVFFIAVFDYQASQFTRYQHNKFYDAVQPLRNNGFINKAANIYSDSIYNHRIEEMPYARKDSFSNEQLMALDILKTGDVRYGDGSPLIGNVINKRAGLNSFYGFFLREDEKESFYCNASTGEYLRIKSVPLRYTMPKGKDFLGWCFWTLFVAALLLFWRLVHLVIKKLFAMDLPDTSGWPVVDEILLTDSKLNSLLFIIGSPGSGKVKKLEALLSKDQLLNSDQPPVPLVYIKGDKNSSNVLIADMLKIPDDETKGADDEAWKELQDDLLDKKFQLVIINHFEYDIKNSASNNIKLNLIEGLLQRNKAKLIIISTVHPVNFLDSLNNAGGKKTEARLPEHDLERWHVLLGHFKIVIHPIESSKVAPNAYDEDWKQFLAEETQYGHFLNSLQSPIIERLDNWAKDKDVLLSGGELSHKLSITAHYFYMYIWQSLTREEKFILYDLAEDGLVNPFDKYNLTLLIAKGLIVRENCVLRLFNEGFGNFILTSIGSSEALKIQNQISDNGNWRKLRTPMIILIIALLVFLFTSQQETYATIIKYVTILSVAVPAILKLFSLIRSDQQTESQA